LLFISLAQHSSVVDPDLQGSGTCDNIRIQVRDGFFLLNTVCRLRENITGI
jgi:hypothetical protein